MKMKTSVAVLACMLCLSGISAFAEKQAARTASGPRRYIFSRSTTESSSSMLGISGVPAYVNFPDGSQKCGVYVTRNAGGLSSRMGLSPGSVLLTINNQQATSPSALDRMVSGKNEINYTYVQLIGGLPKVFTSSVTLGSDAPPGWPAQVTNAMSGGAASAMLGGAGRVAPSMDNTPTSTLESHGIDLVNNDRRNNGGLPSLQANTKLTELARKYAEYLLATRSFAHVDQSGLNPVDRATRAGIVCSIRENLGMQARAPGKSDMELMTAAEKAMMDEPPNQENHRGNILCTNGKAIGVGVARNAKTLILVHEIADIIP